MEKNTKTIIKILSTLLIVLLLIISFCIYEIFAGLRFDKFLDAMYEHRKEGLTTKVEAFKKGETLFCKGQVVNKTTGWTEDSNIIIRDDRYYSLNECFLKSK